MNLNQVLSKAIFNLNHGQIFTGRHWSQMFDNPICATTIYTDNIAEYDGEIISPIVTNKKPSNRMGINHANNIEQVFRLGIPTIGVLKNADNRKIAGNIYFQCTPISIIDASDTVDGFILHSIEGDPRSQISCPKYHNASEDQLIGEQRRTILNARDSFERVDILKHSQIQNKLILKLKDCHSADHQVIWEERIWGGERVRRFDVAVSIDGIISKIYEVKTNETAAGCIRSSIGQLMEYEYMLNMSNHKVKEITTVGLPPLCKEDEGLYFAAQTLFRNSGMAYKYLQISMTN
jgi:hypothetical protein